MGLSLLLTQSVSAKPKDKDKDLDKKAPPGQVKQMPPGQVKKLAAAQTISRNTAVRSASRSVRWDRDDRDWDRHRDRDRDRWDGDRDGYRSGRYYGPGIDIYRNWDRGRTYSWNNHRYHWHGGSWVILDLSPRVGYGGGSVVADVQEELRRRGYDAGVPDGVMGGRTRSAILAFQADYGLARTGSITESLLRALDLA
jgi:hypothetical protein